LIWVSSLTVLLNDRLWDRCASVHVLCLGSVTCAWHSQQPQVQGTIFMYTEEVAPHPLWRDWEEGALLCYQCWGESLHCYLPFNLIFVPQCCIHIVLIDKIWIVYKCCILCGGKAWACMLAARDNELDGWGNNNVSLEVAEGHAENTQFLTPTMVFMIACSLTIQRQVKNVISYGFRDWDIVSTNC